MNVLCYVHIFNYRCLQNVGITINPEYDYAFDIEKMQLVISPAASSLPKAFWGSGVDSVTGIIGDNGTGKSTAIRFILNAVVEGSARDDVDGIIVYKNANDLYVYSSRKITIINSFDKKRLLQRGLTIHPNANIPIIETFYYMGHFSPEYSYTDITTVGLSGSYNGSEGFRFRDDLEKFANVSDSYLVHPISSYLVAHISQNNYRICRLIIEERLRDVIKEFVLPRFIHFAPNRSGQDFFKLNPLTKDKLAAIGEHINPLPANIVLTKQQFIAHFIHFNLLNALSNIPDISDYTNVFSKWYATLDTKVDVLPQFKKFADRHRKPIRDILLRIYEVVQLLDTTAHYSQQGGYYLDAIDDKDRVQRIMNMVLSSRFYLTSRFFDMYYSHSQDSGQMTLSSGEQAVLNLFSRIYDAIELQPGQFCNLRSPSLILLDEAELGYHPAWQQKFIKLLLDFLHSLNVVAGFKYQVILSTHSPVLLSDIPTESCNFLKILNSRTLNVRAEQKQTFATNIFELYRNSFFLDQGLIGLFAEEKLVKLKERIENGAVDVEADINIIGDARLCDYFLRLYHKHNHEAEIRYHIEQLKRLGIDVK